MTKWLLTLWSRRCLVAAVVLQVAISAARAQVLRPLPSGQEPPPFPHKESPLIEQYPDGPSQPPAFTIPVAPLGFSAPGPFYLLRRQSLISLDFLDENRLLFSFQIQQLMRRDDAGGAAEKERHIRAEVLTLPDGKIEADAHWVVPDRSRYLWMLKDGHFLLRDSDGLEQGDSALKLAPYLRLPGRLLWLAMDPTQQVLITNSLEPAETAQKAADGVADPASSPVATTADQQKPELQQTLVVRTLQRESGHQIQITRVPWTDQTTDWPINSEGYLTSSKGSGREWVVTLNAFAGGSKVVAHVDSSCAPTADYLSQQELLLATCDPGGGRLVTVSTGGDHLWEVRRTSNVMLPLLVTAQNGSRMAREILVLKQIAKHYRHVIGAKEVIGQKVTVTNTANGKIMLEAPLTPMLDGGGNVAISPSGRRVAILNNGAIQIFELPAAQVP
jgi:hypothetical protein